MPGTYNMIEVASGNGMSAIGYDTETNTLRIEFGSTAYLYRGEGVRPELFEGLKAADSKGRFFSQHIRKNEHIRLVKEDDELRQAKAQDAQD